MTDTRKTADNGRDLAQETLEWLQNQQVDSIPSHYRVGYEHLRGQNPNLSDRLAQISHIGAPLSRELNKLYEEFFGANNDDRLEQFQSSLQQILQQALSITQQPQAQTQHFQQTLAHSRQALEQSGNDLDGVLDVINTLVSETRRLDDSLTSMEQQLRHTSDEVGTLKEQYDQVCGEVFKDPLTGVLNRRGLDSTLQRLRTDSESQSQLSMLMIDLDNFKPFNDRFGHQVGDQVLRFAAKILNNTTRDTDIIARYGGDEFAVLLPDTGEKAAQTVAHHILDALSKNKIKRRSSGEILGTLAASIGVAEFNSNESLEETLERADKGLYASKRNGRNRVTALKHLSVTPDSKQAIIQP